MIDTPVVVKTVAKLTAFIPVTVPRAQIRHVMGPTLKELHAAIAEQGVAPAGPWFTHHLRISTDVFDFEMSVPVASPVAAAGRIKPGRWPAMTVARTVYRGAFENLGVAWGEFNAWVTSNGHTPAKDLFECYLKGPESSPNPADWQTELNRPLVESD